MQTSIPAGSSLTQKKYSVALFAVCQRANTMLRNLTGEAPKQAAAEAKFKGQTSPDMPVVRVTDLSKTFGDTVSMDMFNVIGGKPLVGDVNAEGKGDKLSWSSMDATLQLLTKVVDAGGKMSQQRTSHQLRGIAMANLMGYFPRLETQQMLVHLAGDRGDQAGNDWVIPRRFVPGTTNPADPEFADIMVNPVRAPTYNRHFVVSGTNLVKGGQQLGSITSTDTLKLTHIDQLIAMIDDMEYPLQPVKIADDPAANDEPLYIMLCPPRVYAALLQDTSSSGNIRAFQQNAWNRASYGSKHPLFRGEVGMWNRILVRMIPRSIRFLPGSYTRIITQANRLTATETNQQINSSLTSGHAAHRSILLGAQALANVYGRNQKSDWFASYAERLYNFERNLEAMGEIMNGKAKVRFSIPNEDGDAEPTDLGVIVIDSAAQV